MDNSNWGAMQAAYCPKCGCMLTSAKINNETIKLLNHGKVFQCFNCEAKYATSFDLRGACIVELTEEDFHRLVDPEYRLQKRQEDLQIRISMEEAYKNAAKHFSYSLIEGYMKEEE